jgi:hypothetical protein
MDRDPTVKEHSQHTIGVEFQSRTITIGEKRVKLQVGPLASLRFLFAHTFLSTVANALYLPLGTVAVGHR